MLLLRLALPLILLAAPVDNRVDEEPDKPDTGEVDAKRPIITSKTSGSNAGPDDDLDEDWTWDPPSDEATRPDVDAEERPRQTSPAMRQRECRREDFEDFDQFVNCQTAGMPEHYERPAPPASPVVQDELADLPRRDDRELEELRDSEEYYRRVALGTMIPGGILAFAGIVMAVAGPIVGSSSTGGDDGGPNCTVGKRCGDTCIELADTCHVGGSGGLALTPAGRGLLGGGVVAVVVGSALLAGGSVAAVRLAVVRDSIEMRLGFTPTGAAVSVRF